LLTIISYYFLVGLGETIEQFFIHYLIFFLLSFYGSSAGLMLGSIIDDTKAGSELTLTVILTAIPFSGLIKNRLDLPSWCGWLEYLSPIKYGFIGLLENEMRYRESNIEYLNFELSMWESIVLLFSLGIFVRIWCFFFLWWIKKRSKK
jgi:ABC-type multidrug transport system permease subunit